MTCVIGYNTKEKIYVGWDSFYGNASINVRTRTKLIEKPDMLLLTVGTTRFHDIVNHSIIFNDHPEGWSDITYVVNGVANVMRDAFKELATPDEDAYDFQFLLVYRDSLYEIESNFSVREIEEGDFTACGVCEYAFGVLECLRETDLDIEERVLKGLQVTNKFSPWVCEPLFTKVIEKGKYNGTKSL